MPDFPTHYRRRLPHFQHYGAVLFLTYRLADSLPGDVLAKLRRERQASEAAAEQETIDPDRRKQLLDLIRRRIFLKFEAALNSADTGPTWMAEPAIADIVHEAILHRNPDEYDLVCFTIMPNHVHQVIINSRQDLPIYQTIGRLKSFTATKANKLLGRNGRFWQDESFDHVVREGKLEETIRYVLENPVAAGLVAQWRDWAWSWLNPRIEVAF